MCGDDYCAELYEDVDVYDPLLSLARPEPLADSSDYDSEGDKVTFLFIYLAACAASLPPPPILATRS
jgi:hypothetical protein